MAFRPDATTEQEAEATRREGCRLRWACSPCGVRKDGAPVQNKRAAEQYERELRAELVNGSPKVEKEVVEEAPRFEAFARDFLATYAKNNNKPSEVRSKDAILRVHLVPAFGKLRLDAIGPKEVETYKVRKLTEGSSPKSVNNHLTVLRRVLALAVEWGKLRTVPVIRWLRVP